MCWNQLRDFSSALTTKSLCRMFRMVHTSRTYKTKELLYSVQVHSNASGHRRMLCLKESHLISNFSRNKCNIILVATVPNTLRHLWIRIGFNADLDPDPES